MIMYVYCVEELSKMSDLAKHFIECCQEKK